LDKVVVTLSATLTDNGTVKNTATQPQTFTIQEDMLVPAGPLPNGITVSVDPTVSMNYVALAPNITVPFGPFSETLSTGATFTAPADLAAYVGSGSFLVLDHTDTTQTITGGGGNLVVKINTKATITITVEYDYTPLSKAILLGSHILATQATDPPGDGPFVIGLYNHILGRKADAAGLNSWVADLSTGTSRAAVAQAFWNSPEHRTLEVDELYLEILHRSADPSGELNAVNALLAGASESDIERMLVTSPEYAASHPTAASYAAGLYLDLLSRPGDPTGLASLTSALQGGLSRDAAAQAILRSPEYLGNLATGFYTALLGRDPEAAGLAANLAALESGLSQEQDTIFFLQSDEYYSHANARFG
jgi:hypothetical protein